MKRLLDDIDSPEDLKKLNINDLKKLSKEIRAFLLHFVSKTGGHLASNLGVVELTIALHYCFNTPTDKIIWDVGHQSYVHKILTGRKRRFKNLRKLNGMSGFPKPNESPYDCFMTGHSSTSISAALGFASARDLKGKKEKVVAVIGDGSLTGGIAFEALNNAGRSNTNIIVILNDNQMSISTNVGALSRHLNDIRTEPFYLDIKENVHDLLDMIPVVGKHIEKAIEKAKDSIKYLFVPGIMFEEMGFKYLGPIDGHNIEELINVFEKAMNMKGPIFIHVHTIKGKGYKIAETYPWNYHGVGAFDIKTGNPVSKNSKKDYSRVFGEKMIELASKNKNIVAVSAAMASGTGLTEFQTIFPKRFFDVAIAEQHAVTFSAGLASQGIIPVFAVYSTFLQRAYDQILHDVCLQNLHVVFAVDRAGIVGADGETHQGIFDISYLRHIPNMTIMSPKNSYELECMLEFAVDFNGPIAIRYPRGDISSVYENLLNPIVYGKAEILEDGEEIALLAVGDMVETAMKVMDYLKKEGKIPMLINARFLKPLDAKMIEYIANKCQYVFTFENNVKSGGFGSSIIELISEKKLTLKTYNFAFPDKFIEHGTKEQLFKKYGLESNEIYNKIKEFIYGAVN